MIGLSYVGENFKKHLTVVTIESKFLALLISREKREMERYFPREAGREARNMYVLFCKSAVT